MGKVILIMSIATILLAVAIGVVFNNVTKMFVESYEKADTTIVVHNGKTDTTIVKRQAPSFLK